MPTTTIRTLRRIRRKILKDERSSTTRYLTRRRTFNRMLRALRAGGACDRAEELNTCKGPEIYNGTCYYGHGCRTVKMIFGGLERIFTFDKGLTNSLANSLAREEPGAPGQHLPLIYYLKGDIYKPLFRINGRNELILYSAPSTCGNITTVEHVHDLLRTLNDAADSQTINIDGLPLDEDWVRVQLYKFKVPEGHDEMTLLQESLYRVQIGSGAFIGNQKLVRVDKSPTPINEDDNFQVLLEKE